MKKENKPKSKFRQYWRIFSEHMFLNGGIIMACVGLIMLFNTGWVLPVFFFAIILTISLYNTLSEYFEEKKCNKEAK